MRKYLMILVTLLFFMGCSENVQDKNRIFKSGEKYYVYYEGNYMELPSNIQLTSKKQLKDYYTGGILETLNIDVLNKTELLNDLNKYFPKGIDVTSKSEKVSSLITIPLVKRDGKQYIDIVKFESFLASLPKKINKTKEQEDATITRTINLKGKKIEILNAGGKDGYAKQLGDILVQKYGVVYHAENYEKAQNTNYVINHKLSKEEVDELVNSLNMKHVEILNRPDIKPEADLVILTGNEEEMTFSLDILSVSEKPSILPKLTEYKQNVKQVDKYKDVNLKTMTESILYYHPNQIYTAKRIQSKLGKIKIIEDTGLNDKIVILTKE